MTSLLTLSIVGVGALNRFTDLCSTVPYLLSNFFSFFNQCRCFGDVLHSEGELSDVSADVWRCFRSGLWGRLPHACHVCHEGEQGEGRVTFSCVCVWGGGVCVCLCVCVCVWQTDRQIDDV